MLLYKLWIINILEIHTGNTMYFGANSEFRNITAAQRRILTPIIWNAFGCVFSCITLVPHKHEEKSWFAPAGSICRFFFVLSEIWLLWEFLLVVVLERIKKTQVCAYIFTTELKKVQAGVSRAGQELMFLIWLIIWRFTFFPVLNQM